MRTITARLAVCTWSVWLAASLFAAEGGGPKVSFKRTQLDAAFRAEGVAVGDFNGDGRLDIAAGSVYYAAPDWKMRPVLAEPKEFSPQKYSDAFACFADDVDGDGRTDLIVVDIPGKPTSWFEQPDEPGGSWQRHLAVDVTNNETPLYVDVTGDGRRDLVFGHSPDPANPDSPHRRTAIASPGEDPRAPWPIRAISAEGAPGSRKYYHGLGAGDINGDGRIDVVVKEGWFENPQDADLPEWPFHRAALGEDCANLCVWDFDGDGDNDVVSSSAHRFGIWWHEQTPGSFQTHTIVDDISQTHAVCQADINGDGLPDFVTGKRWWAHMGHDPGSDQPAVVVWFELVRRGGRPLWIRHTIDTDSGVGTQFEVADVNGDGLADVVTANKKGVYYFEQVRK